MADLASDPLIAEIREVVQRIALMSHAPIQGYNFAPNDVGRGQRWRLRDANPPIAHLGQHQGKSGDTSIPRGAVDRRGDFIDEYRQKSHVYFSYKLDRILRRSSSTTTDLEALLREAKDALEDWCKTPKVSSIEPPTRDSFDWKCAIADDDRPLETIKREYVVSKATIYRYRAKFRGLRRSTSERAV